MSFESIRSLEIELEEAERQNDKEYAHQIRYNIMMWSLKKNYGTVYDLDEVEPHKECNSIETEGALVIFDRWCVEHGFEEYADDAYNNLYGQRGAGWTLNDWYAFPENEKLSVSGCMVNGSCVYAEVWYEDSKTGFIRIN